MKRAKQILSTRRRRLIVVALILLAIPSSLFAAQFMFVQPTHKQASVGDWQAWAAIAWAYFQPTVGVNSNTGLNYGTSNWHRVTDWDLATYVQAILAAERLGILQPEGTWGSTRRIERILRFLETRTLTKSQLSYLQYDSETGKVPEDMRRTPVDASDWGRLLLALDDLRHARPQYEQRIVSIVSRNNSTLLGESDYFASPDIYPFYVAQGYSAFGYTTPELKDLPKLEEGTVDVYGLLLPKAWITSDPVLLAILENRTSGIYRSYADRIYEVQRRRYQETGVLTAFGEGPYPNPPYYVYEWITTARGEKWVIQAGRERMGELEILYTKNAFAMHAIYPDDYTAELVEKVSSLSSQGGFYEGIGSDGAALKVLSDKANSMILQAAAYAIRTQQVHDLKSTGLVSQGIVKDCGEMPTVRLPQGESAFRDYMRHKSESSMGLSERMPLHALYVCST